MGGFSGPRRLRVVAAAILMILGAALPGLAEARIASKEFLASPGAKAFMAKDFAGAIEGFRALLATHPDDPLVMRYIGIALDRLGRHDEAVEAFGEARRVAPGDVSIVFFLGVSEYNRANFKAAEAAFAEVVARAPDTKYAARARESLAAIKANATQQTSPAAKKRWSAFFQLGLQYDDNVAAAPDSVEDRDSLGGFEYLKLGYNLINSGGWRLRAEASGYLSQHWQNDFDSHDIQYFEAAAALDHATALAGVSVVPALRYGYTGTYLDADGFSAGHRLTASTDLGWTDSLKTRLIYRAAIDDYEVDGLLPAVTSRDGLTHEAGVTQYVLFDLFDRESRFSLGYQYKNRNADGVNHDSRTHTASIGLSLALPKDFTLALGGRFARDKYRNFEGLLGPRETDIRGASVAISRPITGSLGASLSYGYHKENSNYPTLDYDRNIVTFALGYSF